MGNRPRALKVVLGDPGSARAILSNAKNLSRCSDDRMRKCSVKPDLTPEQQKIEKALYNDLKAQKALGRSVRIRAGRIVDAAPPASTNPSATAPAATTTAPAAAPSGPLGRTSV